MRGGFTMAQIARIFRVPKKLLKCGRKPGHIRYAVNLNGHLAYVGQRRLRLVLRRRYPMASKKVAH